MPVTRRAARRRASATRRSWSCTDSKGSSAGRSTEAGAGDIVVFSGIEDLQISDTVCTRGQAAGLPPLQVDEPTITMTFQVNKSPFAGNEGKYLTSRQIRARLETELMHNVALRVEDTDDADKFRVSGRGELHLSVLIENMRREGYELAVSRPGRDRARRRRRRARAVGAAHGGLRRAVPGRRDDAARRAQGRADLDDAGRARARAARVSDPGARPDRLPHRVPDGDRRHRAPLPHLRRLRAARVGRDRPAHQRRARVDGARARRSATRCSICRSAARYSSATASKCTKA